MAAAKKTAAKKTAAKKTAAKKTAATAAKKSAARTQGFSAAEREAMKARAAELRASGARGSAKKALEAQNLLDAIAAMPDHDRVLAERVHAIVSEAAPDLDHKTWYGMPAYARDGTVVLFLQVSGKFDARYSTLGFNDPAALDDGSMWPTSWALTAIGPAEEEQIRTLVRRATGQPPE